MTEINGMTNAQHEKFLQVVKECEAAHGVFLHSVRKMRADPAQHNIEGANALRNLVKPLGHVEKN